MIRPLFSVGTARGGTNLLCKMLSVHPEIALAADPYLPLFRSLRNAILRRAADPQTRGAVDPAAPLDDYYFSRTKWLALEEIQSASLDLPFDSSERPGLLEAMAARARLSSSHVVPFLEGLRGDSYEALFRSALGILEKASEAEGRRWVGFNENWAVEFLPTLARSFPEAKFIIFLRDPRGPIASALRDWDLPKIPHVLSFARHWRKALALAVKYGRSPLFRNRLHLLTYEELVGEPERCARTLCGFLDVGFDPGMLDTERYRDADGSRWKGNSHQGAAGPGIYTSSLRAWEKTLPPEAVELIEFVCDPDMELLGYAPERFQAEDRLGAGALRFLEEDSRGCRGWRSDSGDPEQEIRNELSRRALLREEVQEPDPWQVRTAFLDEALLPKLKKQRRVSIG